jgi:hypothetical protein
VRSRESGCPWRARSVLRFRSRRPRPVDQEILSFGARNTGSRASFTRRRLLLPERARNLGIVAIRGAAESDDRPNPRWRPEKVTTGAERAVAGVVTSGARERNGGDMSTRETEAKLVEILREWQHIETKTVVQTAQIMDHTRHPVIRLVMEIIQSDSAMHFRVQQLILDTLEREAITLTVDDLTGIWDAVEAHVAAERRTGELVAAAQQALEGTKNVVQQYLLSYLGQDEKKHDRLLEDLALIKRGIFKSP